MTKPKLLISVSGVRGIVGETLTADIALRYATAFGSFLKPGPIIVGGDTRRTGPMIKSAAIAGLLSTGHDVVDIGIVPTPTVELAVKDTEFSGGLAVTASHNPDPYNALKLIGPGGLFLSASQAEMVNNMYARGIAKTVTWENVGILYLDNRWIEHHINRILDLDIISLSAISRRKLRVVADCVGATASFMAPEFLKRLAVDFRLINSEPSGRFPHPPEPLPENLGQLCSAVKEYSADIGLAFDPDSDRLALVSEKGEPLGEEFTLALGARYILSRKKGPIAVNVSSSLLNDAVANEAGTKIYRAKVGERNVTEKLMRVKGVAGGEGNGGLIYPDLHWGRDAFLAAAVLLSYIAEADKSISKIAGELPRYVMLKTKVDGTRKGVERKVSSLKKLFPRSKLSTLDGIKISGKDWWVQLRASNTEPVVRLMVEAREKDQAAKLLKAVESVLY